ncbi:PLC-like phosphodiesterase [Aspergillus avenaceus]|uniref:PLC-like phosphodiesterase n=1 Tax=Aspergillus avenaceus TaxID=36643 RepID=A0A5N6TNT6_ASPAV|nr:PLC-like phosphodiesterase [Aspergillus avenaceus]
MSNKHTILPYILILLISALFTPTAQCASTCNGHSAYCTRKYSSITQLGAHDSPFVGPLPQHNQNLEVTEQLDLGIRFLQGQTHKALDDDNTIELCHTSCLLEDAGTLESFLGAVKTWLDSHPDEVVTLLLTNGDGFPVSRFGEVFVAAGIKDYAFVPESSPDVLAMGSWPTFGDLIRNGKRLVVFLDYGADTAAVPYILNEFAYFFETPFGVTNASFPDCSIDRPSGASADGRMYIVNHFLDVDILGVLVPDRIRAPKTNAVSGTGSIGAQSDLCQSIYKRLPNVVLLDFVDQGEVIKAQKTLNGI